MAGFTYRKNIDGSAYVPSNIYAIGKNGVTFSIGDLIRINTSGFADVSTTGEGIAGVVDAVVDNAGDVITPDSGTTETWTMGAANQTTATLQYQVAYIPALPHYLFYNDADDTLTRAMELQYFDTNDENDVDVATATDTFAAALVQLVSRDPDGDADASKGLFRIILSQYGNTGVDRAA